MEIPAECALAQYCAHAIAKMNANFGFGPHTPGLGRQPVMEHEASRYFEQLGKALVAAIERDFEESDRRFGVRHTPQQLVLRRGCPLAPPPQFFRHSDRPTSARPQPTRCPSGCVRGARVRRR